MKKLTKEAIIYIKPFLEEAEELKLKKEERILTDITTSSLIECSTFFNTTTRWKEALASTKFIKVYLESSIERYNNLAFLSSFPSYSLFLLCAKDWLDFKLRPGVVYCEIKEMYRHPYHFLPKVMIFFPYLIALSGLRS